MFKVWLGWLVIRRRLRGVAWGLLLDREAPELTNTGLAVGLGLLGLGKARAGRPCAWLA